MHIRITSRDEAPAHYAWASHIISIHDKALEPSLTPISSRHFIVCFDDVVDEGPDVFPPEMSHLRAILGFTRSIPDNGRVLIHCHAGISRSTAVAVAVLIQHGMDYRGALAQVQKIRENLLPNDRIVRLTDEYFGLNGAFTAHFEAWKAEQFRNPEKMLLAMLKWVVSPIFALAFMSFSSWALAADSGSEIARASNSVLQHHRDAAHSGLYIVPSLSWQAARNLRRDPGFHAEIEGPVYAQPLYWSPPNGGKPVLIVVTERNLVYALDAATGAVTWRKSVGAPVPGSSLPCGNISPLGITSTPVIDERSATIYLDAMVGPARGGSPKHMVFALSLRDGSVLPGWPVDVEAVLRAQGKIFMARNQNQRGALALVGDRVYIPYGGHFGDCASYRGWVVGISLHDPSQVLSWSTRARGGGIWAPGGIVSDGRALYAATGNTMGTRRWNDGEAIIRFGLDLSYAHELREFFAPADWSALDDSDLDLGGTNPMLLSLAGAKPSELVLALGKDGKAYLLDRDNLGGIGGGMLAQKVTDEPIRTAPAAFPGRDGIYVAFQGSGAGCPAGRRGDLTTLKISPGAPPSLTVAWCAREHGRGSPIVTTTDGAANPIVWAVGAEGDNRLRGFRGDTGEVVFGGGGPADAMKSVRRFQTLIAAGRRLYVAADHEVYAFTY